jgi:hypothetical protein
LCAERLRANQNRGNLGAKSWENVHEHLSWDVTFQICSSQKYESPSSQLHRSDWSSAGSWKLGENPYRMDLRLDYEPSSRLGSSFSRCAQAATISQVFAEHYAARFAA